MRNLYLKKGFTAIELLVSATVLIIIFSFVLANFRAGQYSGELEVISKEVVDGVSTVRSMALGGQLIEDPVLAPKRVYPDGGYGISFDLNDRNQFVLFADFDADGIYDVGAEEIPNGIIQFPTVDLMVLCTLDVSVVTGLPCQGLWSPKGPKVDIVFPVPGLVEARDSIGLFTDQFVGGVLQHQKTGRQSYFYISLVSGLVTGEEL